ncbi:MAG: hypothetical protein NW224_12270 [Leptolyngbyaceae cyanobacterium bins.302]|nr:hypothetical protein [Leptolyngbyaceae cyanobacterium bins.302]
MQFVGREGELKILHQQLQQDDCIAVSAIAPNVGLQSQLRHLH